MLRSKHYVNYVLTLLLPGAYIDRAKDPDLSNPVPLAPMLPDIRLPFHLVWSVALAKAEGALEVFAQMRCLLDI